MTPDMWGPNIWYVFHALSYSFNEKEKMRYVVFMKSMPYILPCLICTDHFRITLQNSPPDKHITSRKSYIKWMVNTHNTVNKRLHKKIISLTQSNSIYVKNNKLVLNHHKMHNFLDILHKYISSGISSIINYHGMNIAINYAILCPCDICKERMSLLLGKYNFNKNGLLSFVITLININDTCQNKNNEKSQDISNIDLDFDLNDNADSNGTEGTERTERTERTEGTEGSENTKENITKKIIDNYDNDEECEDREIIFKSPSQQNGGKKDEKDDNKKENDDSEKKDRTECEERDKIIEEKRKLEKNEIEKIISQKKNNLQKNKPNKTDKLDIKRFIRNNNVFLKLENNIIQVVSRQDSGSSGIRKLFTVKMNTNYKINVKIQNPMNLTIYVKIINLKTKEVSKFTDLSNIIYNTGNTPLIDVGVIIKNAKVSDYFYLESLEAEGGL